VAELTIIDTFPAFEIERWKDVYMAKWPQLLSKQIECYADDGDDWRMMAAEHVFPFLEIRLPDMALAHVNLLALGSEVFDRATEVLEIDFNIVEVIYCGIGCGAGWATRYQAQPAILLGLENIAECGWSGKPSLAGLLAHEIGHLAHHHWRDQRELDSVSGPWWQLYEEGYAQRLESLVQGHERWHMVGEVYGDNWLTWCKKNRALLASEFLRRVDQGESVRPFFGSWFEFQGYKQTGYFLGHELIKALENQHGLKEIALLDNLESNLRPLLVDMAN
jgi:hypothetical protein